ncbi:MAG: hypothetical protein V4563_17520 [Pseudomonadota bacterium]
MIDKRPRQYAADVCKFRTKDERAAAPLLVPESLRDLTKAHIADLFWRMNHAKGNYKPKIIPNNIPEPREYHKPSLSNAKRDEGRGQCAKLKTLIED